MMLRQGVFFIAAITAAMVITGCYGTVKDNTLKSVKLGGRTNTPIVVAELEVSPKKVMGQASGSAAKRSDLEGEALALALKSAPSADVLVGHNFFYTSNGTSETVTVVGYPARYRNFRSDMVVKKDDEFFVVQQGPGGHAIITYDNSAFTVETLGDNIIRIREKEAE